MEIERISERVALTTAVKENIACIVAYVSQIERKMSRLPCYHWKLLEHLEFNP